MRPTSGAVRAHAARPRRAPLPPPTRTRTGLPCDEQRVVYNGKQLEDGQLLSLAGVQEEATLQVLGRLLGGAKKRKKKTYTKPKKLKHKHKNIKLRVLKFYKVRERGRRASLPNWLLLLRASEHRCPPCLLLPCRRSTTPARCSACASSAPSAGPAPSWPTTSTACTAASAAPRSCWSRCVVDGAGRVGGEEGAQALACALVPRPFCCAPRACTRHHPTTTPAGPWRQEAPGPQAQGGGGA